MLNVPYAGPMMLTRGFSPAGRSANGFRAGTFRMPYSDHSQ